MNVSLVKRKLMNFVRFVLLSRRFCRIDDDASKITNLKCISNQIYVSSLHGKVVKITVFGLSASMETVCNTPVWSKKENLDRLYIISFDILSNK